MEMKRILILSFLFFGYNINELKFSNISQDVQTLNNRILEQQNKENMKEDEKPNIRGTDTSTSTSSGSLFNDLIQLTGKTYKALVTPDSQVKGETTTAGQTSAQDGSATTTQTGTDTQASSTGSAASSQASSGSDSTVQTASVAQGAGNTGTSNGNANGNSGENDGSAAADGNIALASAGDKGTTEGGEKPCAKTCKKGDAACECDGANGECTKEGCKCKCHGGKCQCADNCSCEEGNCTCEKSDKKEEDECGTDHECPEEGDCPHKDHENHKKVEEEGASNEANLTENKTTGIFSNNVLISIGVFAIIVLISCVVIFFVKKNN